MHSMSLKEFMNKKKHYPEEQPNYKKLFLIQILMRKRELNQNQKFNMQGLGNHYNIKDLNLINIIRILQNQLESKIKESSFNKAELTL